MGRQGALCSNVQYATGENFMQQEHAVLVSTLKMIIQCGFITC